MSRSDTIRIIVNSGRGFGHQRAAITLMRRMRELGFSGKFHICYDEKFPYPGDTPEKKKENGSVGNALAKLIPGFTPHDLSERGMISKTLHETPLGEVEITRLPNGYHTTYNLEEVPLVMCAASDRSSESRGADTYRGSCFISLQPTDWNFFKNKTSFIHFQGEEGFTKLSDDFRLSSDVSERALQLPPPNELEQFLLSCNTSFNTQLVYGLYPDVLPSRFNPHQIEATGNLNPKLLLQNLIQAHTQLTLSKPSMLIIPQPIIFDLIDELRRYANSLGKNIVFINAAAGERISIDSFDGNAIYIMHTGYLDVNFFDHLMLRGTNMPPVIEGCNSCESCEYAGRPYIHASAIPSESSLKVYVPENRVQTIHKNASLCLETGDVSKVRSLSEYIDMSTRNTNELNEYSQLRRQKYMERPDAVETALNIADAAHPEMNVKATLAVGEGLQVEGNTSPDTATGRVDPASGQSNPIRASVTNTPGFFSAGHSVQNSNPQAAPERTVDSEGQAGSKKMSSTEIHGRFGKR